MHIQKRDVLLSMIFLFFTTSAWSIETPLEKPAEWPETIEKRQCFCREECFIYATKKSYANKAHKIVQKVQSEFKDDETIKPGRGLVICLDLKEEPILDTDKLLTILASKAADERGQAQKAEMIHSEIVEMKKQIEEAGLDLDLLFTFMPLPIEPNMLADVVDAFEPAKAIESQIDWCLILPTERNVKQGTKKFIKAIIAEKVEGAQHLLMLPMMPMIENEMINAMKKTQLAMMFQVIMGSQGHLDKSEKEKRIQEYETKIGL